MNSLSIVIPAFNEENGVAEIIRRIFSIRGELLDMGIQNMEVIVVDDGSCDRTSEISGRMDGVKLICHDENRGYGAALKTGFGQANGNLIGFLDADGTYPPEYFPKLCEEALNGGEIVIGSRMSGARSDMPLTRRIGNMFFARLLSLLGRQRVTDSASGMRVFKREILEKVYPLPDGLNLTPIMSTRAIHEGIRLVEIPIPYSERVGPSKLSVVKDGSLFLHSITWTVLTYNPVRILGMLGMLLMLISTVIALSLVSARLYGIDTLIHLSVAMLFFGLLSGVGGLSIFCLGLSFNYMVSLFYNKPIKQGLFGRSISPASIEHHLGWIGVVSFCCGLATAIVSLAVGLKGWEVTRMWLYLLGSAGMMLVGVQLIISWISLQILEELSQREALTEKDLNCSLR